MQTISISLPEDTLTRTDRLAESLNRSRAALIKEAVDNYLQYDAWVRAEVQKGLDDVHAGRIISHGDVKAKFCMPSHLPTP